MHLVVHMIYIPVLFNLLSPSREVLLLKKRGEGTRGLKFFKPIGLKIWLSPWFSDVDLPVESGYVMQSSSH